MMGTWIVIKLKQVIDVLIVSEYQNTKIRMVFLFNVRCVSYA